MLHCFDCDWYLSSIMFKWSRFSLEVLPAAMFSSFTQLFLQGVYVHVCVCVCTVICLADVSIFLTDWVPKYSLLSKRGHFIEVRAFCQLCLRLVLELGVWDLFPRVGLQTHWLSACAGRVLWLREHAHADMHSLAVHALGCSAEDLWWITFQQSGVSGLIAKWRPSEQSHGKNLSEQLIRAFKYEAVTY